MNDLTKTFNYKGLTIETHKEVYDPAEDTFLLLDSIDVKSNDSVLEVGTGCGIIALYCAKLSANVTCTDVNPIAIELTKKNYLMNQMHLNGNIQIRLGDLFSPILLREIFDVIIFNPPYLPTTKNELVKGSGWFDIATSGGETGLEVISRFIKELSLFLKNDGRAYIIFSSLSDKNKLDELIIKNKLISEIVNKKNFNDEILWVYSISKKKIKKE